MATSKWTILPPKACKWWRVDVCMPLETYLQQRAINMRLFDLVPWKMTVAVNLSLRRVPRPYLSLDTAHIQPQSPLVLLITQQTTFWTATLLHCCRGLHLASAAHSAKMKVTISLLLLASVAVNAQIQVCDPKLKVRLLSPWDGVKQFAAVQHFLPSSRSAAPQSTCRNA